MFFKRKTKEDQSVDKQDRLKIVEDRLALWGDRCGVGLWEAYMYNADAFHEKSVWIWSNEFRRICGYKDEQDYPNVVGSWFDALHPDDVDKTVAAFLGHLEDKTGNTQYDTTYRLKMPDGSYKWFRATGGCKYDEDGVWVRACGSLVPIHDSVMMQQEAERNRQDDETVMTEIGVALKAVADGDFTHRIGSDIPEKGAPMRADYNDAMERMGEVMQRLVSAAQSMQSGSEDITGSIDALSQRTESQAAALEESAAALVEMTETVKQSADGATKTAEVTNAAKTAAEASGEVVGAAVTAMDEIEKSSEEISRIIGVIDAIAFQTNLLALNASVEAARAGEAGKGFAVVAHEVRELAQRSANAAQEIKTLISKSSDQVKGGVKLVGETGEALKGIVEQVVRISGFVDEIASSTREQSSGLAEINNSVNSMDQMTQQNAAMVSQTSDAASGLAAQAEELAEMVGRFRIDQPAAKSRAA